MDNKKLSINAACWFLRIALAASFLSAVADRFGLWGPAGSPNVAWGNWQAFLDYVGLLNSFAPAALYPVLGWAATIAEMLFAMALLIGWKLRWVASGAGLLLLLFALAMTFSLGIKAPLDFSVFTGSAAAFLLAAIASDKREDMGLERS